MTTPFASILHRDAIRDLVDAGTYERGHAYAQRKRVMNLLRQESALVATVRGTSDYRVRLWVKESALAYSCTCPIGAEGRFCKHGVAVGLAWLGKDVGSGGGFADVGGATPSGAAPPDRATLLGLDKEVLVDVLLDRAASDPVLCRLLHTAVSR